jgi:hypothetical protein
MWKRREQTITEKRTVNLLPLPVAQQPLVGQGLLSIQASLDPSGRWSARRSGLCLTTHNIHKRCMPRRESNPQSQQASGGRPTPWTGRPSGSALTSILNIFCCCNLTIHPGISPGRNIAGTKCKELLPKNTRMYNNGINNVQNYTEVSLYLQWTPSCFRQPSDHLQGCTCKIQSLDIRKYYMKLWN